MKSMKPVTFKYANEDCQSVRGTLVTISDQVEQGEDICHVSNDVKNLAFLRLMKFLKDKSDALLNVRKLLYHIFV